MGSPSGSSASQKTVSRVLIRTRDLLGKARQHSGWTNTVLVLLAIEHQADDLPRLLHEHHGGAAGTVMGEGKLFGVLPQLSRAKAGERIRISLEFTTDQVEVIAGLASRLRTTRQDLIDVAVAAEYGTAHPA